ncbi:MAG: [FeFe] hydrogenase H-cluster radical SAM maturase HydE [Desulfitobacterium sp.]
MKPILDDLYHKHESSPERLLYLLEHLDSEAQGLLFSYSHQTRLKHYGRQVYLRGLIEFSNVCGRNCYYCGIRRDNLNVDRYRLSQEEILACCREGHRLGYRTYVLQSGEDPYYTDERLVELITAIKAEFPDAAVTLSLGERSYDSYQRLFDAGADRYLLRHETASEGLYQRLHPDSNFHNRRQCLKHLQEIGYQVGAGFMVGLPGQTHEDLVRDLMFLKMLEPKMVGIGPFIPHGQTPLAEFKGGTVEKTLIMLALTRLLLPEVLLPSTTAMGTLDPLGREKAIKVGANVVMPNLSPVGVREKYELYEGKICTGDESAHCRVCIEKRISGAGFEVNMGRGDHPSWRR